MGPLAGIKVLEIAGIGPCPIAGMMLADLGAEVILVERAAANKNAAEVGQNGFFNRGKQSIALDLKDPKAVESVLQLAEQSDVLIEGFRPGVMERLGLGPEVVHQRKASLVYGRMTGWGQDGPLSHAAGHDLNYLAISGILHYGGLPGDAPYPTPTVLGDIGSGSNMLVLGILAALLHAQRTGEGQVIDAAICDGAIYNQTLIAGLRGEGAISETPSETFFGGASPWCNSYPCSDGRYITVQALEPNFYRELIALCGFEDDPDFARQHDKKTWPAAREKMAVLFASKPRSHWCELLSGTDACFAPVLSLPEAAEDEHIRARECFVAGEGLLQPAPAPKFSATQQEVGDVPRSGEHTERILRSLGKAG
ncbi:MAG: CoA transferase [Rhodospirillaceae bacterium]|uniref:CaiB/BaiF CoA-transferase family protein n=1 Tax=Halioxenophilus aromaticivorans TaxID=1306992 RepID=A0AAV3U8T2_9ALTE|nr:MULTISPECIES: CaiB/BaiF CoA-transferase family protein [Haliea]MAT94288.1 CoA transferase [Halioglobus sp.]MAX49082.1 CoA transferase [Rhodospirillaceae bacterium]